MERLALLPVGSAFGIGLIAGASGVDPTAPGVIMIDVIAIIALIVMVIVKKQGTVEVTKKEDNGKLTT